MRNKERRLSRDKLVLALGPAFAAGFAVQQLLEILDPLVDKIKLDRKLVLGILSLLVGLALAFGAGLRVLQPLGIANAGIWDGVVTGLIVSARTEGLNPIMRFLGYTKERRKAEAAKGKETEGPEALTLVEGK